MPLRPEDLPTDAARLTELALVLAAENEKLRATVHGLKAMIFGARSERSAVVLDIAQMPLDLGDTAAGAQPGPANDDDAKAAEAGQKRRKKAERNIGALPKHLPRVEIVIEPEATACPCCASKLHRIGEDVNEVLDVVPAILRVLRFVRPKYACRACEGTVVQGKARSRLIESGMASTALVSWIACAKYAWGSTLYRQTQILAGLGFEIDRQTLARWMRQTAAIVKSLYKLQLSTMHAFPRLFCDETPIRMLDPGRGRTKICQFWAHATDDRPWAGPAPPAVAYVFAESRGKKEIVEQLSDFEGALQVDGYAAYKGLGDGRTITLAICLAHARRKFVDAVKRTGSPFGREVVERLAAVYAIEKRIRGLSAERRREVRQAETKPLMAALKARLDEMRDGLSVHSPVAGAIDYALGHWRGLTLFLEDGRLETDTNTVERSIRPISIGKKNSLFCGNEGGGETWAILASLLNTCKLNGVDPQTYLTDVLERIVSGRTKVNRLSELLVWNWKAARAAEAGRTAA